MSKKNHRRAVNQAASAARRTVMLELRRSGLEIWTRPRDAVMADLIEAHLEMKRPQGQWFSSPKWRLIMAAAKIQGREPPILPRPSAKSTKPRQKKPPDRIKAFYQSYEWRAARYDALKANDGRCELCGANKGDGAMLNVDHIKPLKHHWEKRLDLDNLQVLCGACNHGKGNRDTTDWRGPRLATLMGERIA